ncbi:protein kinase [Streptomyces sp. NPDC051133]|uniref:protein kinase domain-containing protein n=1 Tax=Streptomyces sp. NPDC051133 TaxID=3155521 RepID=UPI0034406921
MGEVFAGRYELADPIGRGGVGAVWRAWDHRRRRYVAAKVLQQRDAHSLLRFVREQALRIDHPHVLAPASWAADDEQVLFTMELVGGGSLVHLVNDYGPLPPAFVCTLLDQLLSGLAAVHAEGVVHRDIKPANVLLEATGTGRPRLRLSDFGIAMRLGEPRLTETNLVVGTPGYLAPEQLLGSEPDFPADLFAVGLVALYLLEGAKPDAKALVQHFLEHGTPGAPKGMPEPLWEVVAALLQPDPAARFRTATGARKALASAAELLPEPGPDDELIEIFDQLGPLPPGFGSDGPFKRASGVARDVREGAAASSGTGHVRAGAGDGVTEGGTRGADASSASDTGSLSDTGSFRLPPPQAAPDSGPYPRPAPGRAEEQRGHLPGQAPEGTPSTAPRRPYRGADASPPAVPDPFSSPLTPPSFSAPSSPSSPSHPPRLSPHESYASPQPPAPWGAGPLPPAVPDHGVDRLGRVDAVDHLGRVDPVHRLGRADPVDPSTASYTARDTQVPTPVPRISGPSAHGRRARRAKRRAWPPAKAAIPILLLALACYAVGFWALARV